MGCWSELVVDEVVGLMVSGLRGVPDRVSREAKSFSPSADSFSTSGCGVSPRAAEPSPSVTSFVG